MCVCVFLGFVYVVVLFVLLLCLAVFLLSFVFEFGPLRFRCVGGGGRFGGRKRLFCSHARSLWQNHCTS